MADARVARWQGNGSARAWGAGTPFPWHGVAARWLLLAAVVGGVLLVASLSPAPRPPAILPVPPSGGALAVASGMGPPACANGQPPSYWTTLRLQVAGGFHLTVPRMRAQLRAHKSIQAMAAARHVSARQLAAIELHALHAATDLMVRIGCMTREGADAMVRYYVAKGPADLNARFTWWLTH